MVSEYELVLVAKGDLSEAKKDELIEQVKKVITAEKGESIDTQDWGRRELAYTIKKNTHGFYTIFTFKGNSKTPQVVSAKLNLLEEILRSLIIRKEDKKAKGSEK